MPLSTGEIERHVRQLKRSILRRQDAIDSFFALRDLATRMEKEPDLLPLFRARNFNFEQIDHYHG